MLAQCDTCKKHSELSVRRSMGRPEEIICPWCNCTMGILVFMNPVKKLKSQITRDVNWKKEGF